MKALTYLERGRFAVTEKPKPVVTDPRDAVVRVTLGSICTSDLHIKHGSVPRAVPGITVGHEMVGVVEAVGAEVKTVRPGDRVTVNVETFCGECYFCRHGWVNNCTDPDGGWALGCRIDGGQTEFVRVPYADQGLDKIPDGVTDEQALFVGDILATGFWAARISEITPEDTVLIIGAGRARNDQRRAAAVYIRSLQHRAGLSVGRCAEPCRVSARQQPEMVCAGSGRAAQ